MALWPSGPDTSKAAPRHGTNPSQVPPTHPSNKLSELLQLWQKMLNAERASVFLCTIYKLIIQATYPQGKESDELQSLNM